MKVSVNWLKDYIDIDKSPEQLAEDLSLFGHEADVVRPERSRGISSDYVLDLEITPNRGDCLSILGIAREISAMYNTNLKYSTSQLTSIVVADINKNINVKISDPKICPRFTARIIDGIKIGESSKWMQERLATYGFRPINNIVDITNYVMVATGQPLHAFDYDKIKDGLMNTRGAKQGEEVITLDGKNRILNEDAIIIEDKEKIYDLAGIMGGIKSEVDEKTKTIVLQGAIFDPVLIRKASKHLNHVTDASYRYERGVDFEGTVVGVDMAATLILESCPEAKTGELIDIKKQNPPDVKIELDIDKANKLIGIDVHNDIAKEYLERLGFRASNNTIAVPSYRTYDVKIWQDLAEEVARIYGYNNIKKSQISNLKSQKVNLELQKREYTKDYLTDFGFTEVYSYSFAEKDKIELLGYNLKDCVEIANPLSGETQFLRASILPSLLSTIAKNPWSPEANIFEIEKVFTSNKSAKRGPADSGECWQLGIATTGKSTSLIEERLKFLKIKKPIQLVEQRVLDTYKIRRPVRYVLIDLDEIKITPQKYRLKISNNRYQAISKFAPTVRDLAFVVDKDLDAETVVKYINTLDKAILFVELFDEYLFDGGTKNIAFHIWLQNMNGPVADKLVDEILQRIVQEVSKEYQAKLRAK